MKIIQGDCLQVMQSMDSNSIDFIVTDPPYGLNFMAKDWDKKIPCIDIWKEALRVCKPGAWMACFGGTRTFHRLTCLIEDAGWEIRDCICWLYGSGFPKSHNKFGLEGYGTALKPAYEPIILAMKPCDGTFAQNAEKWGLAGINIDECRIGSIRNVPASHSKDKSGISMMGLGKPNEEELNKHKGRWPANLILDEESAEILDEQTGISKSQQTKKNDNRYSSGIFGDGSLKSDHKPENSYNDSGGASRFFYCAKSSRRERNEGLEGMSLSENMRVNAPRLSEEAKHSNKMQNHHPTVKPISLMRYIIKLLAPPNNPLLLDPFCGSGSTLIAAKGLGIRSIGIELNPEYCEIAKKRTQTT